LHQDAIMQQIFQQMDGVMQRNRETRRRAMRIRTYRVIPLRPKTGVIEWVLDTIPLLEYLDQTHTWANPSDWKWSVCRKKIFDAAQLDHQDRLRVYHDVCKHFKPVLRYFFLEYFKDPDDWLSKRVTYSRSVAASSMIGHVLGLGDRHGQNILLDKRTGEVVHIDLGIAFEQANPPFPVPLIRRGRCSQFRKLSLLD
jgi:serine-protein kinase ATM